MKTSTDIRTRPSARQGPDLPPDAFRELLQRATELAVEHWERLPGDRAYTRPPDALRTGVERGALGEEPVPPATVFDDLRRLAVRYPLGVGHPRWWSYIASSAHPVGIAAELVATALNNPCFPTPQIAANFERVVLRWMAELCGAPALDRGLLVSGGSAANLTCLAAAREAILTRHAGAADAPQLAVYGSEETHFSIVKAVRVLGLGKAGFRSCGVDAERRADVDAIRARIVADRAAGVVPLAIVANAGTAQTGRIDPIAALADLAEEVGCWFHVDGAYGGFGASLPELAPRYRGIERADSLVADAHKWLYVPYEASAALVRDPTILERTFSNPAAYVAVDADGYYSGPLGFDHKGVQLTRSFRALKVWAVLRALGRAELRRLWRSDIAVAAEVVRLADAHPRLEVLARSDLSCFCIRYLPRDAEPDAFNLRLLDRVYRDGRLFLGRGRIDGRFALRGCIVNFRSRLEDATTCVETLVELGTALEADAD